MPSLSLNVGLNNGRKLPFTSGAAPTTLPLSTPTIYVSGLSFQDGPNFYGGVLYSPYTLLTSGYWKDSYSVGFVTYYGGQWVFHTFAVQDGDTPALVATNTAQSTSLPTTGWVNSQGDLIVSGTLVISTTP